MKASQKYYIGKNDRITIRCLACKKKRIIAVADLKLKQHSIKVVCPCSHTFFIQLEFRQSYRKKIGLKASYRKKSESIEQEKPCIIRDISLGGLGITISNDYAFQVEDELIVTFKLGSFHQSRINAIVRVRHIDSTVNIGGAFAGSTSGNRLEAVTLFLQ